ncbi:Ubiquinone biosynthesis protein mitochondrial [Fasciolopsis buskii]|uniref:Ubiquinone biosynthesis protein COQ4 homolog, mitochondrial n=1 Tax=Fasciolopsis buskii TaxID=27845 RepID=A0A8E0RRM3_9TREM|nr:Ubiquinone biosynthesis protein mitochondrial [Fasciolopsis buski]
MLNTIRCSAALFRCLPVLSGGTTPIVTTSRQLSNQEALNPIQLTPLQRFLLTVGSGIGVFSDPRRADLLSVFGELSGPVALRYMRQKMLEDPVGSRILREKPRIRTHTVDLNYLRQLPDNSFGKAYVTFMDHYHYSPDDRHIVRYVDDHELAYVMQRYREIHDLVHTLLEQPTDMLGEVVVKWVEGMQNRLPMCLTGGFFGSLRLAPKQTKDYLKNHLDYALRVGLHGDFLMNVYFEEHWTKDMAELRSSLNIPPPPERLYKSRSRIHNLTA